jgi:hypothetical protein
MKIPQIAPRFAISARLILSHAKQATSVMPVIHASVWNDDHLVARIDLILLVLVAQRHLGVVFVYGVAFQEPAVIRHSPDAK